jgi:hypothetical protein
MEKIRKLIHNTPLVRGVYKGYLKEFEEFSIKNRKEVLWMYRTYLKLIPLLYDRKIQVVVKRKVKNIKNNFLYF